MFILTLPIFLFLLPWSVSGSCKSELGCGTDDRANALVLITPKFPDAFCTGTVINPIFVLTAAHCSSKKTLYVYAGLIGKDVSKMKEEEAKGSKVVDQRVHPKFNRKTLENDLAVFEVSPKLSEDPSLVVPTWLPDSPVDEEPNGWKNCTADTYLMGWTHSLVNTSTAVATCIRSHIIESKKCSSSYKELTLRDRVCVTQQTGVCFDVGGAVMCNGEQVGVVSYVYCDIGRLMQF
ncbi:unnamed protein product, partial [Callosobruchus maculatus]